MQNIKKRAPHRQAPLSSEAPAKTELFVMLPMDIIAVGELTEGEQECVQYPIGTLFGPLHARPRVTFWFLTSPDPRNLKMCKVQVWWL